MIEKIRRANPQLAAQISDRGNFLLDTMIPDLIKIDRLMMVLVRCGNGRFMCPVQDVQHFIKIIEEHNGMAASGLVTAHEQPDYIRDISLPVQQ
jgi:hypothetical protein